MGRIVLAAVIVALLAGGGVLALGGVTPRADSASQGPLGATVRLTAARCAPKSVRVRRGQSIRFVNRDRVVHALRSTQSPRRFPARRVRAGASYRVTLRTAGRATYACTRAGRRTTATVVVAP